MLKKRVIGVVTVKTGWAVQSFGYRRYMPLGRPEILVQNLDRWGVDEILVQCIDRSIGGEGPDIEVLSKISQMGISTPLIYAGGIRQREDALRVISKGADRLMVDALLLDDPYAVESIARDLGAQAIIAHLSARVKEGCLMALDYRSGLEFPLDTWLRNLPHEWISELMVTDWYHEGQPESFDEQLLAVLSFIDKPLLCFGGISHPSQIQRILDHSNVVGAGVGNFLSYREHAVQALKRGLGNSALRLPYYEDVQ